MRQAPQKAHHGGGRNGMGTVSLVGGLGDRLRREALLRSQMAVAALTSQATGHAPCSYLVSKTVRTVKSPVGSVAEIDIEYGTDEEDPLTYDRGERGEVVVEQMSSEWWVEGSQPDPLTLALRRGKPALQAIAAAAAEWVCSHSLYPVAVFKFPLLYRHLYSWLVMRRMSPLSEILASVCLSDGTVASPDSFNLHKA